MRSEREPFWDATLAGLGNIMSGDEFDPVGASGLNPGARVGPYELIRLLDPAEWRRSGWRGAPTEHSSAMWR